MSIRLNTLHRRDFRRARVPPPVLLLGTVTVPDSNYAFTEHSGYTSHSSINVLARSRGVAMPVGVCCNVTSTTALMAAVVGSRAVFRPIFPLARELPTVCQKES